MEDSLWSLRPVQDIDKVLTIRYGGANETLSLLYCDLYLRRFKETLNQTMVEQESVFEDQIHELHRLYQRHKELMMEMEGANNLYGQPRHLFLDAETDEAGLSGATGFSNFTCIHDLNEPAKIDKHSDYELNPFLSPAQPRCERAEPEVQDPPISTTSQAENGLDLNMSQLPSEQATATLKTIEPEQPRESISASLQGKHGTEPSRSIVLALPCLQHIPLFHSRSSWSRKKAKPKPTTLSRSKARRGSKNGKHSQEHLEKGSATSLPRNQTIPGKKRIRKPQKESGKVMRKIARTKSKSRGSFLVTEEEEQEQSAAAEALVAMSLSESGRKKTSDCITPLHWFASSVIEDSKSEVGLSSTYIVHPKHKRTPRSQGKRQRQQQHEGHHNEIHPSLRPFTGNEAFQDLSKIGRLIKTSETNDTQSGLMENMIIDWGIVRKRSRGIRTPAAHTKTP